MNTSEISKTVRAVFNAIFNFQNGLIVILLALSGYVVYDVYDRSVVSNDTKAIVNHLVWNIKGECFFVKPSRYAEDKVYLVKVSDCNKEDQ